MSDNGPSIIIIDDLLVLTGPGTRIMVMKAGEKSRIVDAKPGNKPSEEELVRAMV